MTAMKYEKKELNKNQLEITVHISKSDAAPSLAQAAEKLSTKHPIKGFRPGKAPFEIVKKEFGEAALVEEALDELVNKTLNEILTTEKINPYGRIMFDLLPAVDPYEITAYKAVVTLMPTVKLGDWQKSKIKRQEVKITDEELDKALGEFSEMLVQQQPVERAAQNGDKVVIDFETIVDGHSIEGGTAQDFELILGEGKMIPGFEENVVGKKSDDEAIFTINFPADYHAKHLGGKPAEFKVKVKQVAERIKPAIDDELAKRVGVADLNELKAKLRENILKEKKDREEERVEIAAIKQISESSTFSELPEEMIGETAHELVHEFEHTLSHQGMPFDRYLQSINKKESDLIKEFEPKAAERIKASMALGQLAEDEKLTITNEEVEQEIAAQKKAAAGNQKMLVDINHPEYRRHVANSLINRKIINFLKSKLVE
ncbi:MAG: trigger factor [Candidatus Doudnabacteria bacterium]|nr:trigger factor [Candidatus Doudnabacteria bacterium]